MGVLRKILRLVHWGPIVALSVIGTITTATILCDLQWWPVTTFWGAVNMAVFLMWNVLTLYHFFTAAFNGPGYVEFGWKPKIEKDEQYLQFCTFCDAFKVPRSHHCRKCQRCVMKMDHHCPWINNCVGHRNHGSFTLFLFFAPCGCIHGLFILIPAMYRALNRDYYASLGAGGEPLVTMTVNTFIASLFGVSMSFGVAVALAVLIVIQTYYILYGTGLEPMVHLGLSGFIGSMFGVGLAFGVIIAVGALFTVQMKSIVSNETGIESWIIDKAEYRDLDEGEPEFVFPYHVGRWKNLKQVLHWNPRPELDGIWWPVIEGCNQFSLTFEQIKQKKEKKDRSIEYSIQEAFSGTMCPVSKGPRICCCPPCTDEPRIAVRVGDKVIVTRWKKHWLYGDKKLEDNEENTAKARRRVRGWFPRRCALEEMNGEDDQQHQHNHHHEHGECEHHSGKAEHQTDAHSTVDPAPVTNNAEGSPTLKHRARSKKQQHANQ